MNYVCGPVAGAAARDLMWVLGNISEINPLGVERMVRSLALLQVRRRGLGKRRWGGGKDGRLGGGGMTATSGRVCRG